MRASAELQKGYDRAGAAIDSWSLTVADARDLIAHPALATGPQVWADLGAGAGTFTVALASILPPGSVVHAIDADRAALRKVPHIHGGVQLVAHAGDFTTFPWPFGMPDGVLMANSLHYVADQAGFLRGAAAHRFLLIEYDTDNANPWVPHPLSNRTALQLFKECGYASATALGRRRSRYRRADIYAVLFTRNR